MIISIFGVMLGNPDQTLKYGKQKFTPLDNGYITTINGESLLFQYYPSELERINLSEDIQSKIANSQAIIIVFNPNMTDEELQYIDYIRYELQTKIEKPMGFGILKESEKYALNILSCDNATNEIPFIIINDSSETAFSMQGDCIYMNARLRDNIAAAERLIYTSYGVMS
jgi:hypothetical protein